MGLGGFVTILEELTPDSSLLIFSLCVLGGGRAFIAFFAISLIVSMLTTLGKTTLDTPYFSTKYA